MRIIGFSISSLYQISKIEFVDMIKKEYPRKKKIHEMLDECLEEGDEIEI